MTEVGITSLRVTKEVRDRIKAVADSEDRTMMKVLERTFPKAKNGRK